MNIMFRAYAIFSVVFLFTQPSLTQKKHKDVRKIKEVIDNKLTSQIAQKLALKKGKRGRKKIFFSYQNKELIDVINELAAEKKVNIIIPQQDTLKGKLTFNYPEKITVDQAWDLLYTILDIAGFSMLPKGSMYHITPHTTKDSANIKPLPLYINTDYTQLPDTNEQIRFIYFFSNITLQDKTQHDNLKSILSEMLPPEDSKSIFLDANVNSLIIASSANRIKSAMSIISALDQSGFAEAIEVIKLKHIPAQFVEELFIGTETADKSNKKNGLIHSSKADQLFPWQPQQQDNKKGKSGYFAQNTRVVALPAIMNAVAIMGKTHAIERVKEFIKKYIDVPLDKADNSVIHVIEISNLNADEFRDTLEKLIQTETTKQANAASGKTNQLDFSSVKISAETSLKLPDSNDGSIQTDQTACAGYVQTELARIESERQSGASGDASIKGGHLGGNKLIIAARNREWQVIKQLIKQIDVAQPQVALEVLIVDLALNDSRALGSQLRSKLNAQVLMDSLNFQSAQLASPWLNFSADDTDYTSPLSPPGLAPNLLSSRSPNDNYYITDTTGFDAGSTAISFDEIDKDGKRKTWNILQLLNQYTNAQALSHPFVVVSNNQCAVLSTKSYKMVDGGSSTQSNTATVERQLINDGLTITVTPRINDQQKINLSLAIEIKEFVSINDPTNPIKTRNIRTNATVQDQQILVLGGLDRAKNSEGNRETPVLGKAPLLGWLFKKRSRNRDEQTLMVFIVPRILRPRLGNVSPHTWSKIELAQSDIDEQKETFEKNIDPITRTFFKSINKEAEETLDAFVRQETFKPAKKHVEPTPDNGTVQKTEGQTDKKDRAQQTKSLKQLIERAKNPLKTKNN